jgi:hypothetical protein
MENVRQHAFFSASVACNYRFRRLDEGRMAAPAFFCLLAERPGFGLDRIVEAPSSLVTDALLRHGIG